MKIDPGKIYGQETIDNGKIVTSPISRNLIQVLSLVDADFFVYREIELYYKEPRYSNPRIGQLSSGSTPFYKERWKEIDYQDVKKDVLQKIVRDLFSSTSDLWHIINFCKVFGDNINLDLQSLSVEDALVFLSDLKLLSQKDNVERALSEVSSFKEISNIALDKVRQELINLRKK